MSVYHYVLLYTVDAMMGDAMMGDAIHDKVYINRNKISINLQVLSVHPQTKLTIMK